MATRSRRVDPEQISLLVASLLQEVSASAGGVAPAADPARLRLAVRQTLDLLAQHVPGRAVEVRVPPYAAVQCVPGPRHTRGTPSNVVETDPLTWLALAAGTLSWAEATAAGSVSASGERADLSAHLPLLPKPAAPGGGGHTRPLP
jgi:Bacterial SCP ortholog